MNSLSSLLSFGPEGSSSSIPPVSAYVAVTDTLASSGSFLAIYLARTMILTAMRRTQEQRQGQIPPAVVWVGCEGSGEAHWRTLLRKAGVNAHAQARLKYLDAAEILLNSSTSSGLKDALSSIRSALSSPSADGPSRDGPARTLVVIDDLSALLWTLPSEGPSSSAHHGAALCTLQHGSATALYADTNSQDTADDALLRLVLGSAEPDVWVEVRGLRSGRARDCDGEIIIRPLVRPQLALLAARNTCEGDKTGSGPLINLTTAEAEDDEDDLSAFALPHLSMPPRPLLFRVGADAAGRIAGGGEGGAAGGGPGAAGQPGQGLVEEWRGVQLWARGMMRGFL
ncbi:hypothetical protein OC842_001734 [Tilletia horrida]|uniref:Uncharacterized protein n=1 Tax=Tilletia horrida TaxID=155126 RepID=A0AAN6GF25_9BASI|nr:hypothetical protein OC842_001734 [Tilletia horrida]